MDLASASAKRMNVFAPVIKITEVSQSINFFVVMDNTFFFSFLFFFAGMADGSSLSWL